MPRPYHSASSLSAAFDPERPDSGCDYAWALTYIANQRPREFRWEDIAAKRVQVLRPGETITDPKRQCTPKQRSAALGKALHACGENYFLGRPVNWSSLPGQIYGSGVQFLPKPKSLRRFEVEAPIGVCALPGPRKPGKPWLYLDFHGLRLAGFRDLTVHDEAFASTLEIRAPGGVVLLDYKSTSNILEYSKSPEDLRNDVQCCGYALDVMRRYGLDAVACRWVYFEARDIRRAVAVDVLITRSQAEKILRAQIPVARRLDSFQTLADAKRNPMACEAYGKPGVINCVHHVSNGGTCDVRRPMSALIQLAALREKRETMSDDKETKKEELQKRLEAARAAKAAKAGGEAKAKPLTAEVAHTEPEAPKPRKPRAAKARPEPEPEPEPEVDDSSPVARIQALREQVAELEARNAELQTELDAIAEALA